jgi:multidrug efflux system membrane fusion protein
MRIAIKSFFCFLFLACGGCSKKQISVPPPAVPVHITQVVTRDAPVFIEALAHVDSITSIDIRSRIEGELVGIYFQQGQEVKKGDLLFTIDPKPYEAALKQAEATLEQNLANLALAEEKVKRYKSLAKDEYYSQIDYETLQANFAATKALVQQNRAQVDSAKINLDYCWIYAPIDGMTGILQIDYGNLIANDGTTPLTTLNQMDPIFLTISVPEFELPRIQKYHRQNPLTITAAYETFNEEVFAGTLYMFDNSVDPQTGMIKVRGLFKNPSRNLWPGQFIRSRIHLYSIPDAVIIPFTGVQMTQDGPTAFIVKNDWTVEQRKIELGQREDENVVILKGISVGEQVVIEGQLNLYPGAKVFVPAGGG